MELANSVASVIISGGRRLSSKISMPTYALLQINLGYSKGLLHISRGTPNLRFTCKPYPPGQSRTLSDHDQDFIARLYSMEAASSSILTPKRWQRT